VTRRKTTPSFERGDLVRGGKFRYGPIAVFSRHDGEGVSVVSIDGRAAMWKTKSLDLIARPNQQGFLAFLRGHEIGQVESLEQAKELRMAAALSQANVA
jgi:hypothetical protein